MYDFRQETLWISVSLSIKWGSKIYYMTYLWELNDMTYGKHLAQCLAYSKKIGQQILIPFISDSCL